MIKTLILCTLSSLILSIVCGAFVLPILKKMKAGQPILHYVENHKNKSGTPTMGGLFFILSAIIVYFIFGGYMSRLGVVSVSIGLAYLLVGFLDDFLKIKFKKNEGLKPYQKIIFQFSIAFISGVFCYKNALTVLFIPFVRKNVDLGVFIIPFAALIFLATTNSVNLTDGLDGLAGSTSASYLLFIVVLIITEIKYFSNLYLQESEYISVVSLCACLIGAILGFLVYNLPKARVFMGDTGSLALGGFIGAISIFSSNSLFIPLIGVAFVISSVSVILQVVYFKITKGKRIFLMAPFHHHLQMKGLSETQISFYYSLLTCIMGVVCVIFYL